MLSKINSAGISGVDGFMVSVEVDESNGLPRSVIVGNVSPSVREAMERCDVALRNVGIDLPPKRVTVNLAPAGRRKDGTTYDLAILTGMLRALRLVSDIPLEQYGFLGEIGLDGTVRHINGVLPLIAEMRAAGLNGAVVPYSCVQEALVIEGMDIIGVRDISDLVTLLRSHDHFKTFPRESPVLQKNESSYSVDFSELHGQAFGIRAALIAAAGRHNILLSGTAGSGKTMIARRIPTILPPLSKKENIEITKVYSVAGLLPEGASLINQRPFRTPHHTITTAALIGGSAQGGVIPGELALAANGVLFLDELPLFSKSSIEALRQPMEDKKVVLNRLQGKFTYPADCLIVAAMNPCPCGFYPDRNKCSCTPGQIRSYQRGISKPILERIDLCVEVAPVSFEELKSTTETCSSKDLQNAVLEARAIQQHRFRNSSVQCNADMGIREIHSYCALGPEEEHFMERIFTLKSMSMRTYHKVLKVARTIADLDRSSDISVSHLAEAIGYRGLEDKLFDFSPSAGQTSSSMPIHSTSKNPPARHLIHSKAGKESL